jgi:hypothetical protein
MPTAIFVETTLAVATNGEIEADICKIIGIVDFFFVIVGSL